MKKISMLLATALVCILLSGCGCEHEWREATCIAPKTCALCDKTEGEVGDHKWIDATCTEPKTCVTCSQTEGDALNHTWTEATCTNPKTCFVCGVAAGDALGHTWVDATCIAPKTCKRCGHAEGSTTDHQWKEATIRAAKTCEVCGKTEGEPLPTSYFSIDREDFLDLFYATVAKEFDIGEKFMGSHPLHFKDKFLTLFIHQYPTYSDDDPELWNKLEIIVNDPSSVEYNSNIAEYAVEIGTKCAQILDSTFGDNDILDAFAYGADTASKEWSENYNKLEFWYSKNGFDYYINNHVREIGTMGNYKPATYWYRFTISLSANK